MPFLSTKAGTNAHKQVPRVAELVPRHQKQQRAAKGHQLPQLPDVSPNMLARVFLETRT